MKSQTFVSLTGQSQNPPAPLRNFLNLAKLCTQEGVCASCFMFVALHGDCDQLVAQATKLHHQHFYGLTSYRFILQIYVTTWWVGEGAMQAACLRFVDEVQILFIDPW